MSFVRVNGGVVHYRDEGPRDAPVIVFTNALGTDFRIWHEVAPPLAKTHRLIRYDKRGHGLSEAGPDLYDIVDFARDLGGLLDALDARRATMVGLSIGGLIVQELYRQQPALFDAMILSGTAPRIGTDESWDARIADIERGGLEAIADATLVRWFTPSYRERRSADLAGWRAMLTRTPTQGYLAACGALKRADLSAYAGAIRVPTLCLVGEADGSTTVEVVRGTAAMIPAARFEIVADAGHIPGIEHPEEVARLIAAHVRGAGAG